MNPEDIIRYINQVNALKESYDGVKKELAAIKINEQMFLEANEDIPPGIACKVAYDQHGLIQRAERLQETDIPELQMDHINGLRTALNDKAARSEVESLKKDIKKISVLEKGSPVGTGTKVNYDSKGLVVSVTDLIPSDIPELPMSKIEGLSETIDILRNRQSSIGTGVTFTHPTINPFTATKVTYDQHGHVIKGDILTVNDMPVELITKLNSIESQIPTLASQRSVDNLSKILNTRLEANTRRVTPGVYTKISVDEKGLVTSGDKLIISDLPSIGINDITGLTGILRDKANQSDLVALSENVSSVIESLERLGDTSNIKRDLSTRASSKELKELQAHVDSLQGLMDKLVNFLPGDTIAAQLDELRSEISTLSGRIATLEQKIGLPDFIE